MAGSKVLAVGLLLVALALASGVARTAPAGSPKLEGLLPDPLPQKPRFTLTDTAGRPFAFAKATRGKLTYLYFGYTHCPNACPTTMTDLSFALRQQPASVR